MTTDADTKRRNSGIAGALEGLKPKSSTPALSRPSVPLESPPAPPVAPDQQAQPRGPGRPPGKRSNPAYKQYSVRLRKDTQRTAMEHLRRETEQPDFSELVERLVKEWNNR